MNWRRVAVCGLIGGGALNLMVFAVGLTFWRSMIFIVGLSVWEGVQSFIHLSHHEEKSRL